MHPGINKDAINNINQKIDLTKILTIKKATFYVNKRHIESLSSD